VWCRSSTGERSSTAGTYIDLLIEDQVIVELKSVAELMEVHRRQLLTQLRPSDLAVGLLMNFNVVLLTGGGIRRVVNSAAMHPDDHRVLRDDGY
jgi:GxxExxY protein